jgi:hypothetical protein
LLRTYEEAMRVAGIDDQIVGDLAGKFTRGEVEGQSLTFSPSVAEFTQAAKQLLEVRKSRTLLFDRGDEIPREPILAKVERLRHEYADRPVVATGVTHPDFIRMVQLKELPVGSLFVAAIGTIYGPPR